MNKILCIGEALIDMICTDKGSVLTDGNNFIKKAGGAPTNVAAAIGALGGNACIAAKVGVDPFGQHLINVMKEFNVDTDYLLQDEKHFTTFAFVSLLENGERDFYFNRGADGQLSKDDVSSINLKEFPICHFGSATAFLPGPLNEAYTYLLHESKLQKAYISFDPNYRQLLFQNDSTSFIKQSWHFLEQSNFFKVSDEEALMLTDTKNVADAAAEFIKKTTAVFAITLGSEGTLIGYNGITEIVPSTPIKAVDTTGAGDAFVGAVLFQLSSESFQEIEALSLLQWKSIISNANLAGAKTCEYFGAMEAFKHLEKNIFNGN